MDAPPDRPLRVLSGGVPDQPAREAALSRALLTRVARGELAPSLRLYVPGPTVAFGRLDRLRPGFAAAVASARAAGYVPVLRAPGGHAAAYDEGTLGFDLVVPVGEALSGTEARFASTSAALARELARLGADARVGAVEGEYCRGDFSVNAGGRIKLVGTAQRVVRGGALLAGFLTVSGEDRLRAVLTEVYRALDIAWDPRTVGSLREALPGATMGDAREAVLAALADGAPGPAAPVDAATLALAAELEGEHAVE